jgi:hypothetical protein
MTQNSDDKRDTNPIYENAKALLKDVNTMGDDIHHEKMQYWRRLLGDRLDKLLGSREATIQAFHDANSQVRQGAFSIMALHWKPDPDDEHIFRVAAFSDVDLNVRADALSCLIQLYECSGDRSFGAELAQIVRDKSKSVPLRRTAYQGLFRIGGLIMPFEALEAFLRFENDLPQDLDWTIVDSYLP